MGENDESGSRLSDSELAADSVLAVIAGSDTTATVLAGILYELISNPTIFLKLREAIEETVGACEMTNTALLKVSYLESCIQEGLRLYPVVAGGLQRLSPPDRAVRVSSIDPNHPGWLIPPGTHVNVHSWTLNRTERYFGIDPEIYRPERWPGEVNAQAVGSFGHGVYSCVGKGLALMELRLVLANLVTRYNFVCTDPVLGCNHLSLYAKDRSLLVLECSLNVLAQPRGKYC